MPEINAMYVIKAYSQAMASTADLYNFYLAQLEQEENRAVFFELYGVYQKEFAKYLAGFLYDLEHRGLDHLNSWEPLISQKHREPIHEPIVKEYCRIEYQQ